MSKYTNVGKLPDCDVCKMEFPSSNPNKARFDGIVSGTTWGFMCIDHYNWRPLGTGSCQYLFLENEDAEKDYLAIRNNI